MAIKNTRMSAPYITNQIVSFGNNKKKLNKTGADTITMFDIIAILKKNTWVSNLFY